LGIEDDPEVAAVQAEMAAKQIATQEAAAAAEEREILERIETRRRADEELQRKAAVAKRVADLKVQLKEVDSELTRKGVSVPKKDLDRSAPKAKIQVCPECNNSVFMPAGHCPHCKSTMSEGRSAPKVLIQACTQCNFADVRMPCGHGPRCTSKMSDQKDPAVSWRCGACNLITGRTAKHCSFCGAFFSL